MRALRHPWYVWVVWVASFTLALACPMLVAEPTIVYLADPELLLLALVIGSEHARVSADVRLLQLRALGMRLRGARRPPRRPAAPIRSHPDQPAGRRTRLAVSPPRTTPPLNRTVGRSDSRRPSSRRGGRHVSRLL